MINLLLDFFFPPHCVQCKSFGEYLCEKCLSNQRFYTEPLDIDVENPALDELYACCTHTDGARQLTKAFKYRAAYKLTDTIAQLMVEHIPFPDDIELFVPIPLHRSRQRQRGFNQAELLAKQLSRWFRIPCQTALIRHKKTSPQAELNREQRLTHLQNAFVVNSKYSVKGKVVAVVDDVATTGTTLHEAAKVLKAHGAEKVYGVVFAHGK